MSQVKELNWTHKVLGWVFLVFPHHLISRLVYWLTRIRGPLVTPMISWFIKTYRVEMEDAVATDPGSYPTFNEFFVRELKPEARPITAGSGELCCPVDGTVSQAGNISHDHLFQAKGHCYSVEELLGGDPLLTKLFSGGRFATIYLAPYNYHRIHMPMTGRLKKMIHVPGRLFTVADWSVKSIPRIFSRNERLVCLFSTDSGPMAMILVGAINVAAIETVWSGLVTPPRGKKLSEFDYSHTEKDFARGVEMGRFNMGSTVILLTSDKVKWSTLLKHGQTVKMGQAIGSFNR